MTYILLVVGIVLLIKGADYFVLGSSKIAGLLRVPPLLIGLTVVAFGTSSPEAAVSIFAALKGTADIAIGNVVGSNILNTTLVIGLAAWILPMAVENSTIRKGIPFTLLAGVALFILIADTGLQAAEQNVLSRADGAILLLFFSIFLYYIFEAATRSREETLPPAADTKTSPQKAWLINLAYTIGGFIGVIAGSIIVVNSSVEIALAFGMSETLVGLTIVAIGTSLPEIVTSVAAALRRETEIALGNIVGSSIFNIFFVLGSTSLIIPLVVDGKIFMDILFTISLTVLLFVFSRTGYLINKKEGVALVFVYVLYLIFIIIRN